jgi:prepilin-type N-terminal cleavage/methylation domain-containing protein
MKTEQGETLGVRGKNLRGLRPLRRAGANPGEATAGEQAYTLVEVMVAVFILAIVSMAFYAGLASGFGVTQFSREQVRATQIMMQQLEAVRLCTWSQLGNYNFRQVYDPMSTNSQTAGVAYTGNVVISPATSIPNTASYAPNVCLVTVNLYWTNGIGTKAIPHSRQMQTQVARYGLQAYVWGAIQ